MFYIWYAISDNHCFFSSYYIDSAAFRDAQTPLSSFLEHFGRLNSLLVSFLAPMQGCLIPEFGSFWLFLGYNRVVYVGF